MKLSTQEEFGLRCLVQVARLGEGQCATLAELSRLEGIGLANAGKILRVLRRKGFVRSLRGQAGGYVLALPPERISVASVLAALGGRIYDPTFCERHSGVAARCTHMGDCSIRPVLRQLQDVLDDVLGRLSIKDLLRPEELVRLQAPRIPSPASEAAHRLNGDRPR